MNFKKYKTEAMEYLPIIILIVGYITRILYAAKVGYSYSTHDIGQLSTATEPQYGHLAYIQNIYENRTIPAEYWGQYYHPPLFYVVSAITIALFARGKSYTTAFECVQMMNMIMSFVGTFYAFLILKKLCKEQKTLIIGTLFITFCPAFYIIGAELNNDCFMTTFQIMTIFYTLRWMEKRTTPNILKIALCIVAAMLSKTSGGLVAVAVGCCFLYHLVTDKESRAKLIRQYVIFGLVCIPLGLSFCIYHKILFDLPFTYVLRLPDNHPQYLGDLALWKRLFFPYNMTLNYYAVDFTNRNSSCNVWTQLFYTMNFDEGLILASGNSFAIFLYQLLFYSSVVMYLILLVLMFRNIFSKQVKTEYKLLFVLNYFVLMVMFVKFAFSYPFICTMNYRYIVTSSILLIAGYVLFANTGKLNKATNNTFVGLVFIQSLSTVILYLGYSRI